jgi:tetratricopeptide (TPR) repeat protein
VGDLYQKLGQVQQAVEMWERGVDHYVEGGFHNNAIALCNKILRYAPGRNPVYLKLAQLMVKRGFIAQAKQYLLEYADRMNKAGQLDEAFRALKEFADLSPDNEEIRLLLAEQLKAAARTDEAREQLAKLYHETRVRQGEVRARVTLEKMKAIDPEYEVEKVPPPKVKVKAEKSSDLVFLDLGEESATAVEEPVSESAPAEAPAPPPLEIEPTALMEEPPAAIQPEELPIERASVEFDSRGVEAGTLEGLTSTSLEQPPAVEPPAEFEPTALGEVPGPEVAPLETASPEEPEVWGADLPLIEVPEEEAQPAGEASLEVPELDLGGPTELPVQEPEAAAELEAGTLDLEIEVEPLAAAPAAEPPAVGALEARVAAQPDDPEAHRALGEALIEVGERERGLAELDVALGQFEAGEQWSEAEALAEEILRLDPNSVRHHQKRVEFAFRRNDKAALVEAYLGLSDALLRSGALERAQAVYQRVLEHDPQNERALSALAALAPAPEPAPPAAPPRAAAAAGGKGPSGEFVDLGALVLEDELAPKDTRLRVQDEEPTGDEQRDFSEMLAQFKKGIEASLGAEDVQAHYDLGVAFKEMGLLDEAIAEFQKALRGSEGRLRTSEALGTCFFEKGQYHVAATVLRRAVESDPGGDEDKIGLLYWLGRCEEELGHPSEALGYYQRVFAVDIRFQDVGERVKTLAQAGR